MAMLYTSHHYNGYMVSPDAKARGALVLTSHLIPAPSSQQDEDIQPLSL
jgi:hypothetical protein